MSHCSRPAIRGSSALVQHLLWIALATLVVSTQLYAQDEDATPPPAEEEPEVEEFVPTIERCTTCPPELVFGDPYGRGEPFSADWFADHEYQPPFFPGLFSLGGGTGGIPGGTCRCCRELIVTWHTIELFGFVLHWPTAAYGETDCFTGNGQGGTTACVPPVECHPDSVQFDTPCTDENGDGICAGDSDNPNESIENFDNEFGDDPLWGDRDGDNIPNIADTWPDGPTGNLNPNAPLPRNSGMWFAFFLAENISWPGNVDPAALIAGSTRDPDINGDGQVSLAELWLTVGAIQSERLQNAPPMKTKAQRKDPALKAFFKDQRMLSLFLQSLGDMFDPALFGGADEKAAWMAKMDKFLERIEAALEFIENLIDVVVTENPDGTVRVRTYRGGVEIRMDLFRSREAAGLALRNFDGNPGIDIVFLDESGSEVDRPRFFDLPKPADSSEGDPIDTWSGGFIHSEVDLRSGMFRFERFYNSRAIRVGIAGANWSMPYLETHVVFLDSTSSSRALVYWGDGTTSLLERSPTGMYEGTNSEFGKLRSYVSQYPNEPACDADPNSYMLRKPNGMLYYFCPPTTYIGTGASVSWLRKIVDPNGNAVAIQRNIGGRPTQVTDERGLEYTLTYDVENQLLTDISGPRGVSIQYTYDLAEISPGPTITSIYTGPGPRPPAPLPLSEPIRPRKLELVRVDLTPGTYLDDSNVVQSGSPYTEYTYYEHPDTFAENPEPFLNHNLRTISNSNGLIVELYYEEDESNDDFDRVVRYDDADGRTTTIVYADLDETIVDAYGQSIDRSTSFIFPDQEMITYFHGEEGRLLRRAVHNARFDQTGSDLTGPLSAVGEWVTLYEYGFEYSLTRKVETTNLDPMGGRQTIWTLDLDSPDRFQNGNVIATEEIPDHDVVGSPSSLISTRIYDPIHNRPQQEVSSSGSVLTNLFGHQELDKLDVEALQEVSGWEIDLSRVSDNYFGKDDLNGDGSKGGTGLRVQTRRPGVDLVQPDGTSAGRAEAIETLRWDANGRTISVTDAAGITVNTIRRPNGIPFRREFVSGATTLIEEMLYDDRMRLLLRRERDDRFTEFVYDGAGRVLMEREWPNTFHSVVSLDGVSIPVYSTDPDVVVNWMFYDRAGNRNGVTRPLILPWSTSGYVVGATMNFLDEKRKFSADGLLVESERFVDTDGVRTSGTWLYEHDGQRRPKGYTTPSVATDSGASTPSLTLSVSRDPRGLIVTQSRIREDGTLLGVKTFEHNEFGEVTRKVNPVDADGDGNAGESLFEFDGLGRMIATIDPDGVRTEFDLDVAGRAIERRTIKSGIVVGRVESDYDALGRVTETRVHNLLATGAYVPAEDNVIVTRFGFGAEPERIEWQLKDPSGAAQLTRFLYDDWGRGVGTVRGWDGSPGQLTVREELDSVGRVEARIETHDGLGSTGISNPSESRWTYSHDGLGRILTQTDPAGETTQYEVDARGTVVQTEEPSGRVVQSTYDSLGRNLRQTEIGVGGDARTTHYEYDIEANLVAIVDSNGSRSEFAYDAASRKTRRTYPDGNFDEYDFDDSDRMISMNQPGVSTTYGYSESGRLVQLSASGADADVSQGFDYDAFGNPIFALDTVGTRLPVGVWRTFSSAGWLVSENTGRVVAGSPLFREYRVEHRGDGSVAAIQYPSGSRVEHDHDGEGRVERVRHFSPGATTPITVSESADPYRGTFRSISLGSGLTGSQMKSFDSLGRVLDDRVQASDGSTIAGSGYEYDSMGNLICRTRYDSGVAERFDYDDFERLNSWENGLADCNDVSVPPRTVTWDYDDLNNVTTRTDSTGQNQSPSVNLLNQYGDFGELTLLDYNDRGEQSTRVAGGVTSSWSWDALGRPYQSTDGAIVSDYFHDPFGRMIGRAQGLAETIYVYFGSEVLESFDFVGGIKEYVYGSHGLWRYRPMLDERLYLYVDPFANVEGIHDGAIALETYRISPFGTPLAGSSPTAPELVSSSLGNDLLFQSLPYFFDLKLTRLGARFYDSKTQGFTSRDPLGELESTNLYVYAGANPYRFRDPSGLGKKKHSPADGRDGVFTIDAILKVFGGTEGTLEGRIQAWIATVDWINWKLESSDGERFEKGTGLEALSEAGEYAALIETYEWYKSANTEWFKKIARKALNGGLDRYLVDKDGKVDVGGFLRGLESILKSQNDEIDSRIRGFERANLAWYEQFADDVAVPILDGLTEVAPYVSWVPFGGWAVGAVAIGRSAYKGEYLKAVIGVAGSLPIGALYSGSRAANNFGWDVVTGGAGALHDLSNGNDPLPGYLLGLGVGSSVGGVEWGGTNTSVMPPF